VQLRIAELLAHREALRAEAATDRLLLSRRIGTCRKTGRWMAAMARNFYLTAAAAKALPDGSLREGAYNRAAREARRFLSGGDRSYPDIRVRLDELIADGRREFEASRVSPAEIEAWDTSFRAMFLLCAWRPL